ncbi:PKD domain-containing protein [Paracrocinitomix mangrovi]|uniref:PKD domain-containing protein n=1 Tax=Paracrocinitomix mangrovi TaxID=2862509 RepID=UPI001C8D6F7B|nr:PKD domain-containing protein [Paracrocinitomix mangrovi]UKN00747.1 PKD domain-containing protein [Paracrocinitomix mangrovi]
MKKLFTLLTLMMTLLAFNASAQVSFTASQTSGCAPLTVNFINTSTQGDDFWWYIDGNSFNQTNVQYTFTNGGYQTVYLDAYSGGSFIGSYNVNIDVFGPPSEVYFYNGDVKCPGDFVEMNCYMAGAASYSWDFGDGSTASGDYYQQHTYSTPGDYYINVTITSSCGTHVVTDTVTIDNNLPYFGGNAYFNINPVTVCPNTNIWGNATNGYSAYSWDFGDGNTASGNDYEQWSYTNIGSYNVNLTISNGCGVDTVLTEVVTVSSGTPVQNPQLGLPDTVCPNAMFWADAWSDDGIDYVWDMGDGSPTINNQSHEHTYTSPGIYTATCVITNNCGNSTTETQTVVVSPNAPVNNPYFSTSQNVVCPGDIIDFWANWEYDVYIDFGDGTGANDNSVYHSYDSPGTYPVSATIQNACGNSITLYDTISVQNNLPINLNNLYANAWPSPACPGTEIEFDAAWGYQSYQWNFGDGTTSTNQNADHIYNSTGIYNVDVLITNGCGNQGTATVSVDIQDNLPITNIYFEVSNDTICPGNNVSFMVDDGNDNGYSIYWDLGDGTTSTNFGVSHSYDNVGVYPISLTLTNGCGNDSTIFDTVVVSNSYAPQPGDYQVFAQQEGCVGDDLYFVLMPSGSADITWDFGDGNSSSTVQVVDVQGVNEVDVAFNAYTAPGTYWATYTLTNACGFSVTDSVEINVGGNGASIIPDVSFWWDETQTACQGQPIEFVAVGGATYVWDFGDGTGNLVTYQSLSPVYHTYANPGSYTVSVSTINQCGNTDDSDENIFIPQSQMDITTNTVVQSNCGTNNGMAVASVSGGMPPYQYSWTNGDQSVIADSLASGIYVLTVTDNNGCSNEAIATVSDEEGVTILLDNIVDVDCYGEDNGSISVSILGGAPPYNIQWSNGDQTEDIFGLQAGPYEIFVTDANGCFAVKSYEVQQPTKSNVSVITTPSACGGSNGTAVATVNNGTGPYNFIWPNATGPSNQTGGLEPGIHTLLVIDGNTCLLQKNFAINEQGGPIIVTDSTFLGTCNGDLSDIYISTIGGQQPFTYTWSNSTSNQDLLDVLPGEYEVEVTGNNGCSSYASFVVAETSPSATTICMVDVDTNTQTNLIVWEDINDPGIAYYNIYKESSEAGLFYLIGTQSADSLSQYFDTQSDPSIRSWSYKVSSVDDCGNESELSDEHKTIHLTTNQGIGGEINLIWDHYQGFSYSTYFIHRYHPSTGWEVLDSLSSSLISYTDFAPPGDSNLVYRVSINTPGICTATNKAQDYNSSRSNNESINFPEDNTDLGVSDENYELNIYPNPTNGLVQIKYTSLINEIRLYDISGKMVYATTESNNTHQIDMSAFESGVYTIQIFSDQGLLNGKIIKE